MSEALRARVESMLSAPLTSQLSLFEEIAIARVAAVESVRVAGPALEGEEINWRAVVAMREALRHVADLVEAQSRIDRSSDHALSQAAAQLLVGQLVAEVRRVAGDAVAERVSAAFAQTVTTSSGVLDPVALLRKSANELAAEMDAATLPPDPGPAGAQPGEVQDSVSGPALGEDGAREASPGEGAS